MGIEGPYQELIITYFHNRLFVDYDWKESKSIDFIQIRLIVKLTSDVILGMFDDDKSSLEWDI